MAASPSLGILVNTSPYVGLWLVRIFPTLWAEWFPLVDRSVLCILQLPTLAVVTCASLAISNVLAQANELSISSTNAIQYGFKAQFIHSSHTFPTPNSSWFFGHFLHMRQGLLFFPSPSDPSPRLYYRLNCAFHKLICCRIS